MRLEIVLSATRSRRTRHSAESGRASRRNTFSDLEVGRYDDIVDVVPRAISLDLGGRPTARHQT